tara:strand:+ start:349 stop:492 length:144 start_codon:yes stop_codon:yes gene_type:complete
MKDLRDFFLISLAYEQDLKVFKNNCWYHDLGQLGQTAFYGQNGVINE